MQNSEETEFYRFLYDYFFRLLQIIDEEKALTSSQALANQTLLLIEKVESKAIPKTAIKVYLYLQSIMDDSTFSCYPSVKTIAEGIQLHSQTVRKNLHLLEKLKFVEIRKKFEENGRKTTNEYFLKTPFFVGGTYEVHDSHLININNNINKENLQKSEKFVVGSTSTPSTQKNNELFQELVAFGCFPSLARKAIDKSVDRTRNLLESYQSTNKTTYLLDKYKPAFFGALKMLTENATVETIMAKYEFTKQKSESRSLCFIEIISESGVIMPLEFETRKDAYKHVKQDFQFYSSEADQHEATERWLNQHLKLIV